MSRFGDGDERLYFNGLTAAGRYVQEPLSEDELAQRMLELEPDWMLPPEPDPRGTEDPTRQPRFGVDPMRLDESGWAVVWPPGVDPAIKRHLSDLLDLRAEQAGRFYKETVYRSGEGVRAFLGRHKAPVGPADPARFPYYVLLVGDPRQIPYSFQWGLDQVYAVGRIHFAQAKGYADYARSVLDVEEGRVRRRSEVSFFAPEHEGDRATHRTRRQLVEPLMEYVARPGEVRGAKRSRPWKVRGFVGPEASKERLGGLFAGDDGSALLMTGCHGMEVVGDEASQLALQGALVTSDWPGRGTIEEGHRFAGGDLPRDARCAGLVSLLFACYGAGTPALDSFSRGPGPPRRIAAHPFVADLAMRLLSCPAGGAQAVIGHVDRAWTTSFSWYPGGGQEDTFQSVLDALFAGLPVGAACEWFDQHAADLATELAGLWEQRHQYGEVKDRLHFGRLRVAYNDLRNFVVFGDPAVRLAVPGLV
jgi:hypothetical protein